MQALTPEAQHAASMYLNTGGAASNRQLPYVWPGCQFWDGTPGLGRPQPSRSESQESKPDPSLLQSQQQQSQLASMARLQCVGNLQAALLSGMVQPTVGPQGSRGSMGQRMDPTIPAPFAVPDAALSVGAVAGGMGGFPSSSALGTMGSHPPAGMISLPAGVTYDVPASAGAGPAQQLSGANYWQRALALAAVQQVAATGQGMYAASPLVSMAAAGGHVTPAAPLGSTVADEKEMKRQKRKLSNRESARRSRLRKQAELHDMVHEVRKYTVKNTHLKLERDHLRRCTAMLTQQNTELQVQIEKANSTENAQQPANEQADAASPGAGPNRECSAASQGRAMPKVSGSPHACQDSEATDDFDVGAHACHSGGAPCSRGLDTFVTMDAQEPLRS